MPAIDIEKCVKESIKIFNNTPPSAGSRAQDNPANRFRAPGEEQFMNLPEKEPQTVAELRSETCPRISPRDLVRISHLMRKTDNFALASRGEKEGEDKSVRKKKKNGKKECANAEVQTKHLVVDVRSEEEFASGHLPYSVNVPFVQAISSDFEFLAAAPVTKVLQVLTFEFFHLFYDPEYISRS